MKKILLLVAAFMLCVGSFVVTTPEAEATGYCNRVIANSVLASYRSIYGVIYNGNSYRVTTQANGAPFTYRYSVAVRKYDGSVRWFSSFYSYGRSSFTRYTSVIGGAWRIEVRETAPWKYGNPTVARYYCY